MLAKSIEILPPTKSAKNWAITFTKADGDNNPVCGKLVIQSNRTHAEYELTEFPTGWAGRGFHLAKLTDGADADSEAYDLFISPHSSGHTCDCKGFTYAKGTPRCKHIESVLALLENRWV